jgi:hypothetical protein
MTDIKIILGSLRFKSAVNTDSTIQVPFVSTQKELDEFDRNVNLSLSQLFNDERQASSIFRPTFKIDFIFKNAYSGYTSIGGVDYKPFTNNLAYVNPTESIGNNIWSGYPQYFEFDLMRTDNDISGYTINSATTQPHISFVNKSASTYNWVQYITYPYENDDSKKLQYYITQTNSHTWTCSDGIPFYIKTPYTINGQPCISFVCPVKHNLNVGDWVELEFINPWNGYNGIKTFQVYKLGDLAYKSSEYIFNIYDIGFTGTSFTNLAKGTFKKIVDINNSAETKSIYYVRKHQVITSVNDAILNKAAYTQNGFGRKIQPDYVTPNNTQRVSLIENNQSYLLNFSKDIDISQYRDNLNRPITQLFLTIINKGYFGWFSRPIASTNSGIREGFEFNLSNTSRPYWSLVNNNISKTNLTVDSYNRTQNGTNFTFYYTKDLNIGDVIDGDFCEFNKFLQEERVISNLYHKIYFNPQLFKIEKITTSNTNGYYYQPHHPLNLRTYSSFIEEESILNVDSAPDYAYFSEYSQTLIWRDIYEYGFVDDLGVGVDYPFINNCHYPTINMIFRVLPEGSTTENITTIVSPIIDECE